MRASGEVKNQWDEKKDEFALALGRTLWGIYSNEHRYEYVCSIIAGTVSDPKVDFRLQKKSQDEEYLCVLCSLFNAYWSVMYGCAKEGAMGI